MEFYGEIVWHEDAALLFALGFLFVLCYAPLVFFLTGKRDVVRYVLLTYLVVYFGPQFWIPSLTSFDFSLLEVVVATNIFFVMLVLGILLGRFMYANYLNRITFLNHSLRRKGFLDYIADSAWPLIGVAYLIFVLNPKYSGLFVSLGLVESDTLPRFAIYGSPVIFQAFFAVLCRVAMPALIMMRLDEYKPIPKILALLVLCAFSFTSLERQNLLIFLFAVGLSFAAKGQSARVSMFLLLAIVIFGFGASLQGNISGDVGILEIIEGALKVLVGRIWLDPIYMFGHILEFYPNEIYWGSTNRIFGLFADYADGFSAIGLMADIYLNFRMYGFVLYGLFFGMLLTITQSFIVGACSSLKVEFVLKLFCFIAFVSLLYSNMFSLVPIVILILIYLDLLSRSFRKTSPSLGRAASHVKVGDFK